MRFTSGKVDLVCLLFLYVLSAGLVQMDEQRLLDWGAYPHISYYGHSSLHLGSGQEQGQDV